MGKGGQGERPERSDQADQNEVEDHVAVPPSRRMAYWARTLAFWVSNSASVMTPRSLRSASFAN